MKNILNLIFAIVVMMGFSLTSFARNVAAGNDPNMPISKLMQAGTLPLGSAPPDEQVETCVACQTLKIDINANTNPSIKSQSENSNESGSGKNRK